MRSPLITLCHNEIRLRASLNWQAQALSQSSIHFNLREVAKALVSAPEAWSAPRSKLKRPGEWMIAALRAAAVAPADIQPLMQAHNLLGEPLWRPPAPKGFDDNSAAWTDGLAQRLDIANQLALRLSAGAAPPGAPEAPLWARGPP